MFIHKNNGKIKTIPSNLTFPYCTFWILLVKTLIKPPQILRILAAISSFFRPAAPVAHRHHVSARDQPPPPPVAPCCDLRAGRATDGGRGPSDVGSSGDWSLSGAQWQGAIACSWEWVKNMVVNVVDWKL